MQMGEAYRSSRGWSKGSSRGTMITKRPYPEERIGEVTGSKRACCGRGFMQRIAEELMAMEKAAKIHKGDRGRGSEKCHKGEMTAGVREREIAEIKAQLQVLEERLQEQEKQQGKWIFPLKGKRVIWRRLQRKLRQILIALLEKGLRILVPEMKFEESTCRYVKRKVLKKAVKTKKSCGFKANELCMFAGAEEVSIDETENDKIIDDFLSYWVNPDQLDNVKPCIFVADNCDVMTGFTEEDVPSCENVTAQEEVLMDETQIREVKVDTVEHFLQTESLYAGDEMVTTESWDCESLEDCTEIFSKEMTDLWHELNVLEKRLEVQRIRIQNIKAEMNENKEVPEYTCILGEDVAEGQEVWEAATSIVTAQTTVMAAEEALMPCDFYSNNCFVSTGLNEEAGESLLDKEIDLIRRIMLKGSQRKTSARERSSRGNSKRKTTEDCESVASGGMQHKVWKPGGRQRPVAHGDLQHKVWDPGT